MKVWCIILAVALSGCSSKDMAMQLMADIKENPPVKSVKVTKAGTKTTEYYDTTSIRMKLAGILMQNETLEWAKVLTPVVANVGTTWVSGHYQTKQNKAMWGGIEAIAGDRYSMDGGSVVSSGGSSYYPTATTHAPAVQ